MGEVSESIFRRTIYAQMHSLGFWYIDLFWNKSAARRLGSKIKAKFWLPVKSRGEVVKVSNEFYQFNIRPNTFDSAMLGSLGD